MRKALVVILSVLVLTLALTAWASAAITVTDRYTGDENIFSFSYDPGPPPESQLLETYREKYLIPYSSHDGYAVVNAQQQFFDKIVTYGAGEAVHTLFISVENQTPYTWSDYHFELWNSDFTQRATVAEFEIGFSSFGEFSQYNLIGSNILEFFDGSVVPSVIPDAPSLIYFIIPIDGGSGSDPGSYGLRQIATTTPVPGALWLLGSGLLGLAGWRRFSRS